jgi:hypothetical protein
MVEIRLSTSHCLRPPITISLSASLSLLLASPRTTGRPLKQPFRIKAQAASFEAELRSAARRGEAFDVTTGRPVSWAREDNDMTWYDFCVSYVDMKWKHSAGKRRATIAWALVTAMPAMITASKGKPVDKAMRTALRQWGFNAKRRARLPGRHRRHAYLVVPQHETGFCPH